MKAFPQTLRVCGMLLAVPLLPTASHAATVANVTSAGVPASGVIDLSAAGTLNWAAWNSRVNDTAPAMVPYAIKSGGTGLIGDLLPGASSTNVRGTSTVTSFVSTFTWAGGTAAITGDGILTGGFGGSNLNSTGNGVTFTISGLAPLAVGESYLISVYGAAFNVTTATMTATATGATPVSQLSQDAGNTNQRLTELYQFSYAPTLGTDTLNIRYALTTDGSGANSHVTLQGVAISVVPEPAAALLGGLGAIGLIVRRRRA